MLLRQRKSHKTSQKRKAPRKPASRRSRKARDYNERYGDEDYTDYGAYETTHTDDDYDYPDDGTGFVHNGRIEEEDDSEKCLFL